MIKYVSKETQIRERLVGMASAIDVSMDAEALWNLSRLLQTRLAEWEHLLLAQIIAEQDLGHRGPIEVYSEVADAPAYAPQQEAVQ